MGLGASNLSKSQLSVYQESITKIGQNLRAKASNTSSQTGIIKQTINLTVGKADKCAGIYELKEACNTSCYVEGRGPTYECQLRTTNQGTNSSTCDVEFGTMENALSTSDGICNGTKDMDENIREEICYSRALRLVCPNNPVNDEFGTYGYPTNTCNNECGKTIWMQTGTNGNNNTFDYQSAAGQPHYSKPSGTSFEINTNNFFTCGLNDRGGINYLNGKSIDDCLASCNEDNICDVLSDRYDPGIMDCKGPGGGLCVDNTSEVHLGSDQMAEANIKAEMTAAITNDFQSEVMKTITQANEGLNFQQFNTSEEMTKITQLIKNSITSNISTIAKNDNVQDGKVDQTINFTVDGRVYGSVSCPNDNLDYDICNDIDDDALRKKCQENVVASWTQGNPEFETCLDSQDSEGRPYACGCDISNNAILNMKNKQEAKSIIDSIFNSTVMNNLTSKYTLTVDQLNKGPTLNLIWIFVALILGGAYVLGRIVTIPGKIVDNITKNLPQFVIGMVMLVGSIALLIWLFTKEDDVVKPKCETPIIGCETGGGSKSSCNIWNGCEYDDETSSCITLPDNMCKNIETGAPSSKDV